jgi:hypothetical protein
MYDIMLEGNFVCNSGEMTFDSEKVARSNAKSLIAQELVDEFEVSSNRFEIITYKATY